MLLREVHGLVLLALLCLCACEQTKQQPKPEPVRIDWDDLMNAAPYTNQLNNDR